MKNLIEFIEIEGFQSQYNTRIDLSEGMTALTGLSMDGKTAVLRAFEFVRKNRPSGFKFNYRYEDIPTRVSIGVDSHIITHMKSDKALNKEGHKALYIIKFPDGSVKEISAYGTNVPDEVDDILNISDIAIQSQLDPYMLILSTTGQIAATINKITGIDISDKWIKDINKAITGLKAEKSVLENSNTNLAVEIQKYKGIDDIKIKILNAQELDWEYDKTIRDANSILDLVNVNSQTMIKVTSISGHLTTLQTLINRLETIEDQMASIRTKRAFATGYWFAKKSADDNVAIFEGLYPKISLIESIDEEIKNITDTDNFKDFYNNQLLMSSLCNDELESEKDKLTTLLIESGKCYICGSELTDWNKTREAI